MKSLLSFSVFLCLLQLYTCAQHIRLIGHSGGTCRCADVQVLITNERVWWAPPSITFDCTLAKIGHIPSASVGRRDCGTCTAIPGSPPFAASQEREPPPPRSAPRPASGRARARVFGTDKVWSGKKIREYCIIRRREQHRARQRRFLWIVNVGYIFPPQTCW